MEAQIKWDITHLLKANHHRLAEIKLEVDRAKKDKEQEKGA